MGDENCVVMMEIMIVINVGICYMCNCIIVGQFYDGFVVCQYIVYGQGKVFKGVFGVKMGKGVSYCMVFMVVFLGVYVVQCVGVGNVGFGYVGKM